jgi:hypothetical protein
VLMRWNLSEVFLEWEVFQTEIVDKTKTQLSFFFFFNRAFY